jgi:hypothetical protein
MPSADDDANSDGIGGADMPEKRTRPRSWNGPAQDTAALAQALEERAIRFELHFTSG